MGIARFLSAAAGVSEQEIPYGLDVIEIDVSTIGNEGEVVYETDEQTVTARPLDHRIPTVGYRLAEKPRRGRFDPDLARALGVTDPRDFGTLHGGEPVTTDDGDIVRPEQVVGPERPGISLSYCTDTRPCDGSRKLSEGVDLMIHDATFTHDLLDQAIETGHSTAIEAAEVAREAGVKRLLLTHISARYEDAVSLVEEAQTVFPATEAAEELKPYVLDPKGGR